VENRKLFDSNRLKRLLKREGAAVNHGGGPPGRGSRVNKRDGMSKILCDRGFPLYYVIRNLWWLKREAWWEALSPRARRVRALRIVGQRIAMFNEVKNWRKNHETGRRIASGNQPGSQRPAVGGKEHILESNHDGANTPGYCNKCGLCCEVASGMPDFPAPDALPGRWHEVFANGLGRGHRFCPFLWEDNGSGGGFCSIYPLRSNPCRLFASEECEFFWKSSEPVELSSGRKIVLMGRWLTRLVNPGKLPAATTYIAAKRPKLLKFNRLQLVPVNDFSAAVVNRVVNQVGRKEHRDVIPA